MTNDEIRIGVARFNGQSNSGFVIRHSSFSLQCGFRFGLKFIQLRFQFALGLGAHAVDEENSVEVIDLVLHGAGEQTAGAKGECFALQVDGGDVH
jgi:hypothetical protein